MVFFVVLSDDFLCSTGWKIGISCSTAPPFLDNQTIFKTKVGVVVYGGWRVVMGEACGELKGGGGLWCTGACAMGWRSEGQREKKGGGSGKGGCAWSYVMALRDTFTVVSNASHPINKNLSSIANRRHWIFHREYMNGCDGNLEFSNSLASGISWTW